MPIDARPRLPKSRSTVNLVLTGRWSAKTMDDGSVSWLADDLRALFHRSSTATLATQLFKRGLRNQAVQGVRRLAPGAMMVGEAYTLRYIPAREDLSGPGEFDQRHPQRRAIEECPKGAVVIADCLRDPAAASGGDLLMTRLECRGVAGFVTDGGMRDVHNIAALSLPVYAAGPAAPASFHRFAAVDLLVPIGCGGVPVYPGDVVVGDADGVVIVPRHLATDVARDGAEQERLEQFLLEEIRGGRSIFGTYPPDEETKRRYEARGRGR